jgi:hypothetical protein
VMSVGMQSTGDVTANAQGGVITETLTAAGSDDRVGNNNHLLRPPPVPA